jgi:hypothetical protein
MKRVTLHNGAGEDPSMDNAILVSAEMGSATSRSRPGRRHIVRLRRGARSVIVASSLGEVAATRLAEQITELFADPSPQPLSCESCTAPLAPASTGRPPRFCSAACRQAAYRSRQLPAPS